MSGTLGWSGIGGEMVLRKIGLAVRSILCCLLNAAFAKAQTFSGGQITGVIKDSSGAVLPGVTVTATNTGINLARTMISNESGLYTIPALPIGTYEVSAELPGFQKQVHGNVTLQVGDNLRIDFNLVVGQVTDSVMVTSEVPTIQSETAALGTVINNQMVLELPLNGRDFNALIGMVPGAVSAAAGSSLATRGGVSFAGARDTDNSYTLDGVDNSSAGTNGASMKVSVETLQEFKVLTNSYSPEYGRGGGGQVVMTTRSGTSDIAAPSGSFSGTVPWMRRTCLTLPTATRLPPDRNAVRSLP